MREHTPESFRNSINFDECQMAGYYNTMDLIREAAYFNWQNAGCPEGRDVEFWNEAERQIVGYTCHELYEAYEQQRREDQEEHDRQRMADLQGSLGVPGCGRMLTKAEIADLNRKNLAKHGITYGD